MERIKAILAAATLVIMASGCASVVHNYAPKSSEFSEPPLNAVTVAHVGDSMLRQGKFVQHDAIRVPSDTKVGLLGGYTVRSGVYLKQGDDGQTEFYLPARGQEGGEIVRNHLADPPRALRVHKSAPTLCVVTVYSAVTCEDEANFVRTAYNVMTADAFQQTLIYSGRVGDKINVGYREFSNNVARPAFNNNVEYDLRESKVIGYKGARIEVLESTNEYIRYRVLQHFAR
jgi:hypothetical protein